MGISNPVQRFLASAMFCSRSQAISSSSTLLRGTRTVQSWTAQPIAAEVVFGAAPCECSGQLELPQHLLHSASNHPQQKWVTMENHRGTVEGQIAGHVRLEISFVPEPMAHFGAHLKTAAGAKFSICCLNQLFDINVMGCHSCICVQVCHCGSQSFCLLHITGTTDMW